MKIFRLAYFVSVFLVQGAGSAQPTDTIRVRKAPGLIFFFQKSAAGDTVTKQKTDLFYLLVPGGLKADLSIQVENGRLQPTANDSLVRLEFMPGLNYEGLYVLAEEEAGITPKSKKQVRVLNSLINGTTASAQERRIKIRVINKREGKLVLENVFYYR